MMREIIYTLSRFGAHFVSQNTCQLIYSLLSSTCCDIRHIARTVLREVSKIKDFRGKISRSNVKLGQILQFDHFDLGL